MKTELYQQNMPQTKSWREWREERATEKFDTSHIIGLTCQPVEHEADAELRLI